MDKTTSTIDALTYDPAKAGSVYIAAKVCANHGGVGPETSCTAGRPQVSADGGNSWADVAPQDIGAVAALALGVDGRNLYAETDQGVFRLTVRS